MHSMVSNWTVAYSSAPHPPFGKGVHRKVGPYGDITAAPQRIRLTISTVGKSAHAQYDPFPTNVRPHGGIRAPANAWLLLERCESTSQMASILIGSSVLAQLVVMSVAPRDRPAQTHGHTTATPPHLITTHGTGSPTAAVRQSGGAFAQVCYNW